MTGKKSLSPWDVGMHVRISRRSTVRTGTIPDPRDMSPDEFRKVRDTIESRVIDLRARM
jgi:hypothetical protein